MSTSQPKNSSSAPLPVIIATFRGRSVGIPRSAQLYGESPGCIENSLRSAFPALADKSTEMTIKVKAPGMQEPTEILSSAWPRMHIIVTDISAEIPWDMVPERRLKMLTTVGTSLIIVNTPSEKYNVKVNILIATGLDLKSIVELYTAVPVERQVLRQVGYTGQLQDNMTLYEAGVRAPGGDYTDSISEVRMELRPKDDGPIWE